MTGRAGVLELPIYQVDAFTDRLFGGNPAAVCPLEAWIADDRLQAIAAENALSETAFFVREGEAHRLRWFTPTHEVDLCGHATLASAFVILSRLDPGGDRVAFETASGRLIVERGGAEGPKGPAGAEAGEWLVMDFPARPARPVAPAAIPEALLEGLGGEPEEVRAAERDWLAVYGSEAEVQAIDPDFRQLASLRRPGVIATAPGRGGAADGDGEADFVSRFFAPAVGVPEDPVTGSAHCTLVPYWAERLGRRELRARQVSRRGGELRCEARGDRVRISGRAVLYLEGTIRV